jgi:hypothetical protein
VLPHPIALAEDNAVRQLDFVFLLRVVNRVVKLNFTAEKSYHLSRGSGWVD